MHTATMHRLLLCRRENKRFMFWIVTQSLLSGLATTFEIFILTLIFALPLGLIFSVRAAQQIYTS